MATIQDIANEVGISKAAVSRILNHKGSFSQETIRKVQAAARKFNYSSLSTFRQEEERSMKLLAAIFPTYELPGFGYHVSMLEQAAYDYGYNLLICGSLFDREKEDVVFEYLRERKVNGILLGSYTFDPGRLENIDLPVVTVGYKLSDAIPAVRADDYSAGRLAAKHLYSKGCRKPVYISSYPGELSNDLRGRGFRDEFAVHGIETWEYHADLDMQISNDFTGLISLMPIEHPDADGVFTETEVLGMSCMQTYLSLGFRIPEDIRIIGYGAAFHSMYSYPLLTLVRENTELIARKAVSLLVKRIEKDGTDTPFHEKEIIIPISISERKTT